MTDLDKQVALALGYTHHGAVGGHARTDDSPYCLSAVNDWWKTPEGEWLCGPCYGFPYAYSTDWSIGGPIIEREAISVFPMNCLQQGWAAHWHKPIADCLGQLEHRAYGETPLIAAMRVFAASRAALSSPLSGETGSAE